MRWNSKHNGDVVLNRLAELLAKKYPTPRSSDYDRQTERDLGAAAESNASWTVAVKPDLVFSATEAAAPWLVAVQSRWASHGNKRNRPVRNLAGAQNRG